MDFPIKSLVICLSYSHPSHPSHFVRIQCKIAFDSYWPINKGWKKKNQVNKIIDKKKVAVFEYVTMECDHMINIIVTMENFLELLHSHRQLNSWNQFSYCVCITFFVPSDKNIGFYWFCRLVVCDWIQSTTFLFVHTLIYFERLTLDVWQGKSIDVFYFGFLFRSRCFFFVCSVSMVFT